MIGAAALSMCWWHLTDRPPPSATSACSSMEDLLGCPVDLVTEKALRPELRPYIEQERVNV